MQQPDYNWKLKLAREVWRDVRRLPALAWRGPGQPEVLAVGDEGLARKLWGEDGGMLVVFGVDNGGKMGGGGGYEARFDRVTVVGALELAHDPRALLEGVARVLRPDGVALLVVANRRSPWVWWQHSPWSEGRPYSKSQLERLVGEAGLKVVTCRHGVRVPPARAAWVWRLRGLWRTLMGVCPALGGVILLVAEREGVAARGLRVEASGVVKPVAVVMGG